VQGGVSPPQNLYDYACNEPGLHDEMSAVNRLSYLKDSSSWSQFTR